METFNEKILFNEEEHTYTLITEQGEIELTPITKFLENVGLSAPYDNIPKDVLEKAANYGKVIHKELETFIKQGEIGLTNAVDNFMGAIQERAYKPILSETIVYDHLLAGTIDCVFKNKNDELVLCDFKTTSKLYTTTVSWQLSLYAYLWNESHDEKIKGIEAWHFDKNNDEKLTIHELNMIDPAEIDLAISNFKNHETYTQKELDQDLLDKLVKYEEKKALYQQLIKDIEEAETQVKEQLVSTMKNQNTSKYQNDKVSIVIVAGTTRKVFDKTKFEKDYGALYQQYLKNSNVKESVRINLVGKEK